jgi:hypothetical protein
MGVYRSTAYEPGQPIDAGLLLGFSCQYFARAEFGDHIDVGARAEADRSRAHHTGSNLILTPDGCG